MSAELLIVLSKKLQRSLVNPRRTHMTSALSRQVSVNLAVVPLTHLFFGRLQHYSWYNSQDHTFLLNIIKQRSQHCIHVYPYECNDLQSFILLHVQLVEQYTSDINYQPAFFQNFFHLNMAVLLEEQKTNALKLYISQNNHEEHGFADYVSKLINDVKPNF